MVKTPDDHLLTFSIDESGEQLFIQADAAGLDLFIRSLTRLRAKLAEGSSDHDHLMSEAWGSYELSTSLPSASNRTIQHVKIRAWTPEEIAEHRSNA